MNRLFYIANHDVIPLKHNVMIESLHIPSCDGLEMSAVALWTYKTVGPPDLEQLGSEVFFCTEQVEEFGRTQTFLTFNTVFRYAVISSVFLEYDMRELSYSYHP